MHCDFLGILPQENINALRTLTDALKDGQHVIEISDSEDDEAEDSAEDDFPDPVDDADAVDVKKERAAYELCALVEHKRKVVKVVDDILEDAETGGATCYKCEGGGQDDVLLLCDGQKCSRACHIFCCEPVLAQVPADSWYCENCAQSSARKKKKPAAPSVEL